METLQVELRARREDLGLSRERLAQCAGISTSSVEKLELGTIPARSLALKRLEKTLARLETQAEERLGLETGDV
jgi:predicted transcriptional regulator